MKPSLHGRVGPTCLAGAVVALVCLVGSAGRASAESMTVEFASDGVWCWFTDPRAFVDDGVLVTGWVTTMGDVQAGAYRIAESEITIKDIALDFERDDHVHPSFFETSDGRYTTFFSKHAQQWTNTLYRTTINPGDITSWSMLYSTNVNTSGGGGATYSNPYPVPGETNKIYLFWRGANWKPNYSTGIYDTATATWGWSDAQTLITVPSGRPYVKYDSYGSERVGMAFTDGHPRETDNNIYYAALGKDEFGTEAFFRADGTKIKDLSAGPLETGEADVVFDRLEDPEVTGDDSWIWDLAFDDEGDPVVTFVTFPSRTHHQYHYAMYDAGVWDDTIILADAGGSIADTTVGGSPQYYYSGGVMLDHNDPSIVYLSYENALGGWDLEQWKTPDCGLRWSIVEITRGSTVDNIRPVVPRNRPEHLEMVLWVSGDYNYYENWNDSPWWRDGDRPLNYDTAVKLWLNPIDSDVDGDGASAVCVLRPNYPNPFQTETELRYALLAPAVVTLRVYDVSGRLVRTLIDAEERTAGEYGRPWDGKNDSGQSVGSGVYFCRLEASSDVDTRSVLLVR